MYSPLVNLSAMLMSYFLAFFAGLVSACLRGLAISKMMFDSSSFHNGIGNMTRFYFSIHCYRKICNWTVPDVMIAFAMSYHLAVVFLQYLADNLFIFSHYANTAVRSSALREREASAGILPISSNNSEAVCRTRSTKASKDSDSKINPGISSLVQYQTEASSSHVNKTVYSFIDLFLADKHCKRFFVFFQGLVFACLRGLPLPGTLRIFSKSSSVYRASNEKGLHPALINRLLTVFFGMPKVAAISEIVTPVINLLIGILTAFLKNVNLRAYLLDRCIVKLKIFQKCTQNGTFTLDAMCPMGYN
jgi:hypothetical protein